MIWKINHVVDTDELIAGPRFALTGMGISEQFWFDKCCNVRPAATTIWPLT
jgi:hypothetical protein